MSTVRDIEPGIGASQSARSRTDAHFSAQCHRMPGRMQTPVNHASDIAVVRRDT